MQTNNVSPFQSSQFDDFFGSFKNGPLLFLDWLCGWQNNLGLNSSDFNTSLSSKLLSKGSDSETFDFNVFISCQLFCFIFDWNLFSLVSIKNLPYAFKDPRRQILLQTFIAVNQLSPVIMTGSVFRLFLDFGK